MDGPNRRRAVQPGDPHESTVEQAPGVWRIGSYPVAREVLQARGCTTQAGFTSEFVPKGRLKHHPILFSDGPLHDEQRRKVGRFFAPRVVSERYRPLMVDAAERLLADAMDDAGDVGTAGGVGCWVEDLALLYAVDVTRQVVGLTNSSVKGLAGRLVRFFNQPPFDITKPDLGRTRRQWASAAVHGLGPVVSLYLADVRPAVRARRRRPGEDVISHLIAEGYTDVDILVECVTYGTAGMVTTREFIAMALWHLLTDEDLRAGYLAADADGRIGVLEEIIRLEPVVGHIYRRVGEPLRVADGADERCLGRGDLVDLQVRQANVDPVVMGADPLSLCPGRPLDRDVHPAGLSFGDGAHRCPGQALALLETDVLLTRMLDLEPQILAEPRIEWDDLVAGYCLRGFRVGLAGHHLTNR
ncbi:cytochrome P450 [Acidipropionibacterium acidipropionici]|uniref:cytochrome P450 n=1 Tax=Acidipropionibacterium acidipropionici TaxID=1748 RepID=UPI000A80BD3B|nr:cytochrome P450 [Acidipropionibacterium acidipropionici]AZP36709.1 cytochrome P450 [Acidipropionibacterium acidipropionici]